MHDKYDVVIIGAGPAGLTAAAWMSISGIKALLVDKNSSPPKSGHADGIECRTFEVLETFGLVDAAWKESNKTVEIAYWNDQGGSICRVFTRPNMINGGEYHSSYAESTLAQGRVQQLFLDFIESHKNVTVLRPYEPHSLRLITRGGSPVDDYPIQLEIARCGGKSSNKDEGHEPMQGPLNVIQARYLLGCDGSHSWVRKQCDLKLEGESANEHWGVIDCIPITNFPDVRKRCVIHSASGSAMLIPRERRMVRFYVQLSSSSRALDQKKQTSIIIDKVTQILKPLVFLVTSFKADVTHVGQRLCRQYSFRDRVFLAGDAVHTHTPKAGKGMNTSMQDAFNIGWKISSVVLGSATPAILETYQQERLPVGQALLDFDKRIYRMVSLKPDDQDFEAMKQTIQEENSSASGLGVIYRPNLLVHETQIHDLDSDRALRAGSRLPDMMVLNHSDGRPWRMHEILNKAGRWNLLIFGGNVSKKCQMGRVHKIAESLSRSSSLVGKINRASRGCGFSSIELTLIHCASRDIVELDDLPRIFTPSQGPMGIDYTKIFVDTASHTGVGGMVYRDLAIPKTGCIMLIRPDQHVAFRGGLESVSEMDHFLAKFWLCN
ncbi:probable phenol 2-monooxygenase [Fusarium fujikuroi]|nr:probable phenol 2-monooxygenase [Fusarium fujikuroi]